MNLKSLIPALILTANLVSQVEAKLTSTKEALTQTITSAPQQEKRTIKERDAYCRERLDNADWAVDEEYDLFRPFFSPVKKENIRANLSWSEKEKADFITAVFDYITKDPIPDSVRKIFINYAIKGGLTEKYENFIKMLLENFPEDLPANITIYRLLLPPEKIFPGEIPQLPVQPKPLPTNLPH